MPRQNQVWDDIRGEGNPTRAIIINDLIKRVMKSEVRKQGKASHARRPITLDEFYNILRICRMNRLYRLSGVLTLQWQMIGRVDDMMKLGRKEVSANLEHTCALTVQMRWSKNIREERESPRQIVLGSFDDRLCALLNLAVYLEHENVSEENGFLFGNGIDGDRSIRSALKGVLESSDFNAQSEGPLGTHSIRKGPATHAARCGISKDTIESRGRWRSGTRQVDTYMDIQRPYPDAQVAACLCGPAGPIFYKLKAEISWSTTEFLTTAVAPNTCRLIGCDLAKVLALPLIWAAVQGVSERDRDLELLPSALREKILNAIVVAAGRPVGERDDPMENPVERCPVMLSGGDGQVHFVELQNVDDHTDNIVSIASGEGEILRQLLAVTSNIISMKKRIEEVSLLQQNDVAALRATTERSLHRMNESLKRIVAQPIARVVVNRGDDACPAADGALSCLSKRPKDLFELWREFEHGIGGSKPARLFTSRERGASSFTYSLRMSFWSVIQSMVRRGTRQTPPLTLYILCMVEINRYQQYSS